MKIFDRNNVLIFVIAMLCVGILKTIYVPSLEAMSFSELFYKYNVLYGQDPVANLTWLAPMLLIVFFVAKEGYIKLVNFNVRYQNRQRYIKSILYVIIIKTIVYCLCGLLIQGIFLICKTDMEVAWSIDAFIFISKYIIELFFVIMLLVVLALVLNAFTYAFLLIVASMVIGMIKIEIFFVPFISLYVNSSINIVSVVLIIILVFGLYYIYMKKDLSKGESR